MAISSYLIWGILPVYWKSIDNVPSAEILVSRVVWAFISTLLLILLLKNGRYLFEDIKSLWKSKLNFWLLFLASILISGNWFLYIWAVNNGYIVQTSLGYYINPLISVLLGVFFLKEKLSHAQKVAFTLATIGVLILTFSYGQFPWLSFVLAISFGVYGLLKKQIKLDALRGLTIETFFITPLALGLLHLVIHRQPGSLSAFRCKNRYIAHIYRCSNCASTRIICQRGTTNTIIYARVSTIYRANNDAVSRCNHL